jgi:hypothetical protein
MTEDEHFDMMQKQQQRIETEKRAADEADKFINSHSPSMLSTMSLRKVFEIGYRYGWLDYPIKK